MELHLLASCQQTCMTYTIAVCTVENSWWWTEELSETSRISSQNKFEKLVHLVGFIIRYSCIGVDNDSRQLGRYALCNGKQLPTSQKQPSPLEISVYIYKSTSYNIPEYCNLPFSKAHAWKFPSSLLKQPVTIHLCWIIPSLYDSNVLTAVGCIAFCICPSRNMQSQDILVNVHQRVLYKVALER